MAAALVLLLALSGCGSRAKTASPDGPAATGSNGSACTGTTRAGGVDATSGDDADSVGDDGAVQSGAGGGSSTTVAPKSPPTTGTARAIATARVRLDEANKEKQAAEDDLEKRRADYEKSKADNEPADFQRVQQISVTFAVSRVADADAGVAVAQNELDYQTAVVDHRGSHEIDVLVAKAEVALFTAELEQAEFDVEIAQRRLDDANRSKLGSAEQQREYDEAVKTRDEIACQLEEAKRKLAALD